MRGLFTFVLDRNGVPTNRCYWAVDEGTALQVAGADGGRSSAVDWVTYTSPGRTGQTWRCFGLNATFARLDGSLTSNTGPWTDLSVGLADPSPLDTAKTLWLRLVAKRWAPADDNPRLLFSLSLGITGVAGIEDVVVVVPGGGDGLFILGFP